MSTEYTNGLVLTFARLDPIASTLSMPLQYTVMINGVLEVNGYNYQTDVRRSCDALTLTIEFNTSGVTGLATFCERQFCEHQPS